MSSEITIRSIPTEVLCDIFHLLCNGPIVLNDLKNESHFHEFPWAVGQVCRHWRGEFLSYTPLWTSFALRPGTSFSTAYFVEMSQRATIYLERSGQQPLTVVVSMQCLSAQRFSTPVWELLLSCLKRWKKADLVLDHGALGKFLRCTGHMSILESLKISMWADYMSALEDTNAFGVAPCLTELDLAIPKYTAWQFPWAQLTRLTIDTSYQDVNSYSDDLWGVLLQLKNIEELHIITIICLPKHPPSLPGIICFPVLRFLEISLAYVKLFSRFTAPLLEYLHIHGHTISLEDDIDIYDDQRELTPFIQRSSCHIRRLAFDNCPLGEMRGIMKALASVEELSIKNPRSLAIIQDITGCTYLPKLRALEVECDSSGNKMLEQAAREVSRLLEARSRRGSSLASPGVVPLEN